MTRKSKISKFLNGEPRDIILEPSFKFMCNKEIYQVLLNHLELYKNKKMSREALMLEILLVLDQHGKHFDKVLEIAIRLKPLPLEDGKDSNIVDTNKTLKEI